MKKLYLFFPYNESQMGASVVLKPTDFNCIEFFIFFSK